MKIFCCLIGILISFQLFAQSTPTIQADTADVSTVDQLIAAYYDVTSGPAGQRDWVRYRSLFKPEAQINAQVFNQKGRLQYVGGTLNEYIGQVDEYFTVNGFFEKEIGRSIHEYRDIVNVLSAYDAKLATNQASYHRGVKSLQLVFDQNRWWIVNVLYNNESQGHPIPDDLLFEPYQKRE